MRLIYDDARKFEFVTNFGFHRCFREKQSNALILLCRTNATGNTVSMNNDARLSFLTFEPEADHRFHLATPIKEALVSAEDLPASMPLSEYTVVNIDDVIRARGNTAPNAKAS